MRVFLTGGSGVLGSAVRPLLAEVGHEVVAPGSAGLDLFDPAAVREAVAGSDAVLHLATRIPPLERIAEPGAWAMNDRLRAEASRLLVDAALATSTEVYVQPTVTFVYPAGTDVDETTPIVAGRYASAIEAERQADRFTSAGRRGVVLRLGLLYGPGTGSEVPNPDPYGAVLHVGDAGAALVVALGAPAGVYNVVADGGRVSHARFTAATGWIPRH
jgi:nucleoside-diphosphate-sugar epimerase